MSSDPEEIKARVVVHDAGAADEWARPELEAFHLPSTSQSPHFFHQPHPEPEQSIPAPPAAAATTNNASRSPPPPSSPPPAPFETEQLSPNAKPSSEDEKKPSPPAPAAALRDLFRFADGLDRVLMTVGTLGALVHGCSLPVFLRFFADLVDSFGSHADDPDTMVRLVVKYAFYFLVVGAAIWASSWAEISCWMWTGERQSTRMRIRYLEAALKQDVSFFDTDVRTSDVIYAINADAVIVQDAISEKLGNLIHYMATFVAGFVVGFTAAWQLALVTLAVVPLIAVIGGLTAATMGKLSGKSQDALSSASNIAEQALAQIRIVQSFVGEERVARAYSAALAAAQRIGYRNGFAKGLGLGGTYFTVFCCYALLLWYGGHLVRGHHTNGGLAIATMFSVMIGGIALGQSAPSIAAFAKARVAAAKIFRIIDHTPGISQDGDTGVELDSVTGRLELKNVEFAYPSRPDMPVLRSFSLTVPAGKTIALVGSSGSGKSTVVSLIERFYDPSSGEIMLDGVELKDLKLRWLRSQIGLVSQEPALFATSIRENLLLGRDSATQVEMEEAARVANAHSFIIKLPDGYDTQVSKKAGKQPMPSAEDQAKWTSKDRFAAKRLRGVADELKPEKRAIIEQKSAFSSLLNVSPFNIPNELIDYVAQHITPSLREFRVGKKRIVFTRDMITKVFGIRSGQTPVVELKKFEQSALRDVYRGSNPRPDIPTTIKVLKGCDDTDEDTIVRSWDLLCMATVVDPKSSNHVGMDYLGSMLHPSRTHEYAWDEYILEQLMQEVKKMQKKRLKTPSLKKGNSKFEFWISGPFAALGIIYLDHLQFPPSNHVIDYSLPRVCHVKCSDFVFAVQCDLSKLFLHNTKVFGRRPFLDISETPYANVLPGRAEGAPVEPEVNPSASLNDWLVFPSSQELEVPDRYKHLHEKHKSLFAAEFDIANKNYVAGVKRMQSQRMAALLCDVDAASQTQEGPSVTFQSMHGDVNTDLGEDVSADDDEQSDKEDSSDEDVDEEESKGADIAVDDPEEDGSADDDDDDIPTAYSEDCDFELAPRHNDVPSHRAAPDVPQPAIIRDSSFPSEDAREHQSVDSPVRSPVLDDAAKRCREIALAKAPDAPPFDLFEPGTPEWEDFNNITILVPDAGGGSAVGIPAACNAAKLPAQNMSAPEIPSAESPPTQSCVAKMPLPESSAHESPAVIVVPTPADIPTAVHAAVPADIPDDIPTAVHADADTPADIPAAVIADDAIPADIPAVIPDAVIADAIAADIPAAIPAAIPADIPAAIPDVILAADIPAAAVDVIAEPVTPVHPKSTGATVVETSSAKNISTSSGPETHDKKNRHKRAAKGPADSTPPKMKKIKVSQDTRDIYDKFICHGRKLKRQPKDRACPEFVRIGRYYCSYKSFLDSLKPCHYLSSEVMNVWIEKFNREAKIIGDNNPRAKKKFAFTQLMVDKLIVDPAAFEIEGCLKEFKTLNSKFKLLKDDLLYFPIVKNNHWAVPCINLCLKKFHIFDSMRSAKDGSLLEQFATNLFINFNKLLIECNLTRFNLDDFTLADIEHPQQTTLFDCGFFVQLFMENFDSKVMAQFDNNAIPDHRRLVAASLIENRDNGQDAVEKLMEDELMKRKKYPA